MRWHCLQHVPFEGPGCLVHWALDRGHAISCSKMWERPEFPPLDAIDGLIVMGGPMGVHDEAKHAWLGPEKEFVRRSIDARKAVVGICLGAQILSLVMGGKVERGPHREIGWFPVTRTPEGAGSRVFSEFPPQFDAFHWHGDRFSIPPGAARTAESAGCDNQAFVFEERVVGLQFHLEATAEGIGAVVENCRDEMVGKPYVQQAEEIFRQDSKVAEANGRMGRLMDLLAAGL